eukprot:TRINITY_DN2264_c2_g1_i1.p1 TRINITY_DN2264_c2_g1~~TRINITY_DN2264_c2_g1_i1.p1  ORF type:complete len:532 (-),score=213.72 TRINITY_DN2264_c2_g1_i1:32-1585(-)
MLSRTSLIRNLNKKQIFTKNLKKTLFTNSFNLNINYNNDLKTNNLFNKNLTNFKQNGFFVKTLFSFRNYSTNVAEDTKLEENSNLNSIPLNPNEPILEDEIRIKNLKPFEVVAELDQYIVGQQDAKKAIAIALRNRWRRKRLPKRIREEVMPKNILMVGPTGVGKTEIARRLSKLTASPFIKVEATKFTEVGFHGRDVDSIIKDLVEISISQLKAKLKKKYDQEIQKKVNLKLTEHIGGEASQKTLDNIMKRVQQNEFDELFIELEYPEKQKGTDIKIPFTNKSSNKTKKLTVKQWKQILSDHELTKLINQASLTKEAVRLVEEDGIVFIDEIDKICVPSNSIRTSTSSSEGVQRDLLPLIEGSLVETKYGKIDTSKILFIASGAFHMCKPSDLLAELQGRLPIRVELKNLTQQDLIQVLTQPKYNSLQQQKELLKTEGIDLEFTPEAIQEIAKIAAEINSTTENIGARRLHFVIEKLTEEMSFNCETKGKIEITAQVVRERSTSISKKVDLRKTMI